jgi:hypothetical protein
VTKALTERDLLESQIKIYEFYAGLIDRAVGSGRLARLPKWDEERAQEYKRLADELRTRLAVLDANATPAPVTDAGA